MPRDRDARKLRNVRHRRVRKKVSGTPDQPRLCVFRSLRSIYAQIIDDTGGTTLVAASSQEAAKEAGGNLGPKIAASTAVGSLLARRAQEQGISRVVFDRGGYKYHGRVRALAEAAREGGLQF
ncbi:MAG: 50S ribosomal protein L18 [Chloroflexi bacterium]|nr:50S ribosomal protein L18 [Chloroflexota bacterium]